MWCGRMLALHGWPRASGHNPAPAMNIIILDDYQDAVRKLRCAARLEPYNAKVFTNTVKGIGQLSVRLREAEVLVLIRERTHFPRLLLEKLPKLRLIAQTGKVGAHIDVETCTRLGIAVAEGVGSPVAPAELTWAMIMAAMRRLPQYIGNLKHGAWQQSGLKAASMPANFGLGLTLRGRTLGIWGYGKIGTLLAGYGKAFGMQVVVWGSEASRARARWPMATRPPPAATRSSSTATSSACTCG
jgi:D-3-phosphoglycerate dehydrogenase